MPSKFAFRVKPEIRKQIASSYLAGLKAIEAHTSKVTSVLKNLPEMSDEERKMILLALHHEHSLAAEEAVWMRKHMNQFLAE